MKEGIIALVFLTLLSIQDIRRKELSVPMLFILLFTSAAVMVSADNFKEGMAGFFEGAFLLMVAKLTREQIGKGDAIVLMGTGMLLGARHNLELIFIALGLCAVWTAAALIFFRWNRKKTIPFVPFLTAAQAIILVSGM